MQQRRKGTLSFSGSERDGPPTPRIHPLLVKIWTLYDSITYALGSSPSTNLKQISDEARPWMKDDLFAKPIRGLFAERGQKVRSQTTDLMHRVMIMQTAGPWEHKTTCIVKHFCFREARPHALCWNLAVGADLMHCFKMHCVNCVWWVQQHYIELL